MLIFSPRSTLSVLGEVISMTTLGSLPSSSQTTQLSLSRFEVPSATKTSGPRKSFFLTCVSLKYTNMFPET
jgi:hypothetical protein